MTESAYSSIRGAEISERSSELVLPSGPPSTAPADAASPSGVSARPAAGGWRATPLADASSATERSGRAGEVRVALDGDSMPDARMAALLAPAPPRLQASSEAVVAISDPTISDPTIARGGGAVSQSSSESPIPASPSERPTSLTSEPAVAEPSGRPLPGDRGPRDQAAGSPRPSFWRRIALGRRAESLRSGQPDRVSIGDASPEADSHARGSGRPDRLEVEPSGRDSKPPAAGRELVTREGRALEARASEAVERRIVEPLLQALVSVEAKLERSHVDLIGRSDQVEQRLTQLWDIEEQLGALGDLQESVLQVTEQQRRLEAALIAQTRILRWLVGGIILSLAAASFCVAFFLRVTG